MTFVGQVEQDLAAKLLHTRALLQMAGNSERLPRTFVEIPGSEHPVVSTAGADIGRRLKSPLDGGRTRSKPPQESAGVVREAVEHPNPALCGDPVADLAAPDVVQRILP